MGIVCFWVHNLTIAAVKGNLRLFEAYPGTLFHVKNPKKAMGERKVECVG
jgi:hypothetical protein